MILLVLRILFIVSIAGCSGATKVEIRLKNYGADLIEIIDNGSGSDFRKRAVAIIPIEQIVAIGRRVQRSTARDR